MPILESFFDSRMGTANLNRPFQRNEEAWVVDFLAGTLSIAIQSRPRHAVRWRNDGSWTTLGARARTPARQPVWRPALQSSCVGDPGMRCIYLSFSTRFSSLCTLKSRKVEVHASHPNRKNKNAVRVGHPGIVGFEEFERGFAAWVGFQKLGRDGCTG